MQQATIATGIVAGFSAFLVQQGIDGGELVRRVGIDPAAFADPDGRLPLAQYARLVSLGQQMSGDSGLSLRFGAAVGMSDISILGLIMEASTNMGEAFEQMQRYGRLAMAHDPSLPSRFVLDRRGDRLFLVDQRPDPAAFPGLTEEAFAQLTCGPRRFLDRPHVLSVHVTHEAPSHAALYDEVFSCPIHFGDTFNGLELPLDIAGWPVAGERRYVFGVLCEKADQLLARAIPLATIRSRLEQAMRAELHLGEPSADTMATRLGFSRSTLFRRLRDEGTSFARVLDELRRDMAIDYLTSSRIPAAEVAYLVGFSEAAAFSRAFHRWMGQTPGRFRQQPRLARP